MPAVLVDPHSREPRMRAIGKARSGRYVFLASAIHWAVLSGASSGSGQLRRKSFECTGVIIRCYPCLGLIPPSGGPARSTAFSRSMRT